VGTSRVPVAPVCPGRTGVASAAEAGTCTVARVDVPVRVTHRQLVSVYRPGAGTRTSVHTPFAATVAPRVARSHG
jgi:hypothetical protein